MDKTASFYWFDYETFGTHPALDRPCQFAGIRTDLELKETGKPLEIFCQQTMDYLPHPAACRVTGLTPQKVNETGLPENEFIRQIVNQIGKPGTCSLGYNSIQFDDEFTRNTLFRNFFDAYEHEYKNDNSRWDMLDVVRLTRALRPDGINWPVNEDGSPSNRLEHLSRENNIEHGNAHDALSDVRATIGIARLIRTTQPKLFKYAFEHRQKNAVAQLLNVRNPSLCLYVSGMIPSSRSHLSVILPLAIDPNNRNNIFVLDLENDPSELLTMSSEQINERVFSSAAGTQKPGLRTIKINKCPVVVQMNVLYPADAERLGINLTEIQKHADIANQLLSQEQRKKIIAAMTRDWPNEGITDAEASLYKGFIQPEDSERAAKLRCSSPEELLKHLSHFEDKRLVELAWRYQARNYPETLEKHQLKRWREYCAEKLNDEALQCLSFSAFEKAMENQSWSSDDAELRKDLTEYVAFVKGFTEGDHTLHAIPRPQAEQAVEPPVGSEAT